MPEAIDLSLPRAKGWFLSKASIGDNCWNWTKQITRKGYGRVVLRGKKIQAHRLSFELFVGPIAKGMGVLHTCDNRRCIRPDHLFVGTDFDNGKDSAIKDRRRQKLTAEDVREMRRLRADGVKVAELSRLFVIAKSNVYRTCDFTRRPYIY